ncbi:MAG: hypothetical protein ACP6IP_04640 [Candidatus Njordarchaeia archaeon]
MVCFWEELRLVDYIIFLAVCFAVHYIAFYFYNMSLSERLIKAFSSIVREIGCEIRSFRRGRGIHSFVVTKPCKVFSKFIVFTSLLPREMPLNWLFAKLAHRVDYVVLEGNLIKTPILQCELLNVSSPRWRKVINNIPKRGWSHLDIRGTPFHVAVYRPTKSRLNWVKRFLNEIKKNPDLQLIDRISIRMSQPHVIIKFSKKNVLNENLLKIFPSIIKVLEVMANYSLQKSGAEHGK